MRIGGWGGTVTSDAGPDLLVLTGSVPVQGPVIVGVDGARGVAVGVPVQWIVSEKIQQTNIMYYR